MILWILMTENGDMLFRGNPNSNDLINNIPPFHVGDISHLLRREEAIVWGHTKDELMSEGAAKEWNRWAPNSLKVKPEKVVLEIKNYTKEPK